MNWIASTLFGYKSAENPIVSASTSAFDSTEGSTSMIETSTTPNNIPPMTIYPGLTKEYNEMEDQSMTVYPGLTRKCTNVTSCTDSVCTDSVCTDSVCTDSVCTDSVCTDSVCTPKISMLSGNEDLIRACFDGRYTLAMDLYNQGLPFTHEVAKAVWSLELADFFLSKGHDMTACLEQAIMNSNVLLVGFLLESKVTVPDIDIPESIMTIMSKYVPSYLFLSLPGASNFIAQNMTNLSPSTADSNNFETTDSNNLETTDSNNFETTDSNNFETTDSNNLETADSNNFETAEN